jgi:predicted nuclease of predicted toxin-antitoxin system
VKLLFDENLGPSLVRRLANVFPDSQHVHDLGLGRADDSTISTFARDHDYIVVTKDADFRALRLTIGHKASRVVLIGSGNGSTSDIERILRLRAEAIRTVAADDTGILDIV